jgi:lipoate-protein ligase B
LARDCLVYNLGLIDYDKALLLQEKLLNLRKSGDVSDVLLLLQHPSVFTIGRSGNDKHIIVPREVLVREGIQVFHTNRGGDITYHGLGQMVGYPILNLKGLGLSVHKYVWSLEETILRTIADFGIRGQRIPGRRGVWLGMEKICALGVRVSRETTMHGFALNVNPNLKYFNYIIPCGIVGASATSVSKLLGRNVDIKDIQDNLLKHFSEVFGVTLKYSGRLDEWLALSSPGGLERVPLTR